MSGRSDTPAATAQGSDRGVALALSMLGFGPVLILVLVIVVVALITPNFLKPINIGNIMAQTAVIAIVAMGQQIVILTRGIDLSVGANLALATVVGGLMFREVDSALLVTLAMLGTGLAVGLINGLFYVYGRLPHPFIITLATLSICRGLALQIAPGHTTMRGMPDTIGALGNTDFLGIPAAFYVVAGVALIVYLISTRLVWGRWLYAVGGDPKAALEMGVPVKGVLVSAYALSGLCAGIGAVVLSGRTAASSPLYGNLLELDTIAAVIIGGASFLGGRGHLGHALIGAVMIGVIRNALNLQGVNVYFQMIAIGVIIVIAVEADVLRGHLEARARTQQAGEKS